MKKYLFSFLLFHFIFGTFCLPEGDFSVLSDLPKMYQNCKITEDKDMNFVDFFTDHLINIDCIFDTHENGDKQKPHKFVFHFHTLHKIIFQNIFFEFKIRFAFFEKKNSFCYLSKTKSDFITSILKPPILI